MKRTQNMNRRIRMLFKIFQLLLIITAITGCKLLKEKKQLPDLVRYVNPLQGTLSVPELSHGNTYPAICMPFGMNCWTPQTGRMHDGWQYTYTADSIRGFKQTHQPSPWINDYGCFSIMPSAGRLVITEDERASAFSHKQEIAFPHYYKLLLKDTKILTEITATDRCAFFRLTFPASDSSYIIIDAFDGGSYLKFDTEKRQITGYTAHNHGGVPSNFASYFTIETDRDFTLMALADGDSLLEKVSEAYGNHIVAVIGFKTKEDDVVHLKTSSSFISLVQARINLDREIGESNFEAVKTAGFERWNRELNRIRVEGGSEAQKATFYSCLYHLLLFPRTFYELNADDMPVYYSPYDGKLHQGVMMTDNGFWDTFRAVHPFFALMYPDVSEKQLQAIVNAVNEGGWMPQWASPGYRNCMIGNHSSSLIADAWIKGIRNFDIERAFQAMVDECYAKAPMDALGRNGYKEYNDLGYVPYPDYREATAKTLEYAYNDFCVMQVAEALGKKEEAEKFKARAFSYRNVFNTANGFMQGKDIDGKWIEPFDPNEWGGPFTEGNAWHYTWSVFHDVQGLIGLMGGEEKFIKRLDSVFDAPNAVKTGTYGFMIHEMAEMVNADMGQYAHGNQPIQHMIYLYNYAGQPWKTQHWTRFVMDSLYSAGPDGYCGDEDNGQTSAWYVFSALGFYPVTPGYPAYVMGSPLFEKATLILPSGKEFIITANNNTGRNKYVREVKLNGESWTSLAIPHDKLLQGGALVWEMQDTPDRTRGIHPSSLPYSLSGINR